jgi:hypothetical protein
MAPDRMDHRDTAAIAVEQWGPSAAWEGNGTLWPIRVIAANPPLISG